MANDLQTTTANSLKTLGSLASAAPKLVKLVDDVMPGIDQRLPTPQERDEMAALVPVLEAALTPASRAEIRRMIAKLALGFPNAPKGTPEETEARLELYAASFADMPADILGNACQQALKTCRFFPTPAELRDLCRDPLRRAFRLTRMKHLIAKHDREYRAPDPVDDAPMTDEQREWLKAYYARNGMAA